MASKKGLRPLKIILVGSSGVGKTSIINTFFDQPAENDTQPTVAPAYCGATVIIPEDKTKVDLQIWDTAGQERFQSIVGMFYRESDIAFVCFDLENKPTITKWIDRVHAQVPECIIFLVATKVDLLSEQEISALKSEMSTLMSDVKAQRFFLTSAAKKKGVKTLFLGAAKCINQICKTTESASISLDDDDDKREKSSCKC